jgi:hypothetical protein
MTILALREAVTENRVANNLPNSFIDQFQDDSGIGTETDVDRNASEYIETDEAFQGVYGADTQYRTTQLDSTKFLNGTNIGLTTSWNDSPESRGADWINGLFQSADGLYGALTSSSNFNIGWGYNVHETSGFTVNRFKLTRVRIYNWNTNGRVKDFKIEVTTATSSPHTASFTAPTLTATDNATLSGEYVRASNANEWSGASFTGVACNYFRVSFDDLYNNGNANCGINEIEFWGQKEVLSKSLTGTVIGTANVPSSAQTKVSGVMLYKDAYGTATPGTQLKIYFTCNGGTNWTEAASYTAVTPVFSTGIKMVKLGETTCTSGSDVRYKAVWASQVSSTLDTQLHGIGLNY